MHSSYRLTDKVAWQRYAPRPVRREVADLETGQRPYIAPGLALLGLGLYLAAAPAADLPVGPIWDSPLWAVPLALLGGVLARARRR